MRIIIFLATLLTALASQAGEGHDHAEARTSAPATTAGLALPRFSARSELFELVGVVSGKQITLYLDHAASNAPVKDARLSLDIAGQTLSPERRAEGEFELTLARALNPGLTPITATVTTPAETDQLAGEIDVHREAHTEAAHVHGWREFSGWALAGLAALTAVAGLILFGRRLRRSGAAA